MSIDGENFMQDAW